MRMLFKCANNQLRATTAECICVSADVVDVMPDCSICASSASPLTDPPCVSPPPRHQVPELAAFWLLSFMFQLPVLLFFLTDEEIIILPLERAVHSIYLCFLLAQILASFLALRTMTRKLTLLFHLRQFGKVDGLRHAGMSPVYGLPYHRGVLPVSPVHNMYR